MLETPARIEPAFLEERIPTTVTELAMEVQYEASQLERDMPTTNTSELAEMVRIMNCYYSNLIEGHKTRPRDIEQALQGAELDEEIRPLALEARAHVLVQRKIDELHTAGNLPAPTTIEFTRWIHAEFYENMPEELRFTAPDPSGRREEILPGQFRHEGSIEVAVGRHLPPSGSRVDVFMEHYEKRFAIAQRSRAGQILAIPAAHHRLNYIHPFPDGNGRVSRLVSHAMALQAGVGAGGLWSVSRGLARGLEERGEYKSKMDAADSPRRGDRDGRGNLSEASLISLTSWFLNVMLDQIRFSRAMFQFSELDRRYARLVLDVTGDKRAPDLMTAVLKHRELDRGDAALVLKTSPVTARKTVSRLVAEGFLTSATPKSALRVGFPLQWRERLFPNLFGSDPLEIEVSPTAP